MNVQTCSENLINTKGVLFVVRLRAKTLRSLGVLHSWIINILNFFSSFEAAASSKLARVENMDQAKI